jgi:hypothetical protein
MVPTEIRSRRLAMSVARSHVNHRIKSDLRVMIIPMSKELRVAEMPYMLSIGAQVGDQEEATHVIPTDKQQSRATYHWSSTIPYLGWGGVDSTRNGDGF